MGVAVEIAVEISVDLAMEIAVEIAMAGAMSLHGVPLLALVILGISPWNVRGCPWKIRGRPRSFSSCPWNVVDMAVQCRGDPWTLPQGSAKMAINAHQTIVVYLQRKNTYITILKGFSFVRGRKAFSQKRFGQHPKAISYTVGFVSRKRPFSTDEAQSKLSYTVERGLFLDSTFFD